MAINDRQGADMIDVAIQARLFDLKVCLPATVQAYNAAAMTVAVALVTGTYQDGTAAELPVLPDVPVAFPQFGGGALTFPLSAGDPVTLIFSSRAIDAWAVDGIQGDPQSPRYGHLADAIAIPGGVLPQGQRGSGASTTDVQLTQQTGGLIKVGASATLAAARVTDPVTISAALQTWIGSVITQCAANVPTIVIPPLVGTSVGTITSGSAVVKIG